MESHFKLNFLLGLFVGLIVAMNLLGQKIISLFGVSVSVGIFMLPLTFVITDMVAEVYGKRKTQEFVWTALAVLFVVLLYVAIFVKLTPHPRFVHDDAYRTVFGASLRIVGASMVAFFLSQMHDIWAFEFWKRKTQGKYLWLRNNLSTMVSQFLDTTIFMFLAFYRASPKFDVPFMIQLIIPFYLFKLAFAVADTPLVYLGVAWLRRDKK